MSSHTLEGKKKTQNGVKRLAFTVLSILLEVVFLIGIFKGLNEYAVFIDNLTRIFAVILVLKIYGRNETSSMKTPWIILILTFPILGVALYFMIGMNGGTRKMRMRYKKIDEKLLQLLEQVKGKYMLTMFPLQKIEEYANKNGRIIHRVERTISASKTSRRKQEEWMVCNYEEHPQRTLFDYKDCGVVDTTDAS